MLPSIQDFSQALAGLVARTAPSVVSVHSKGARSTGFVWRPGLVVTADEALAEDGDITITVHGGAKVSARLLGRDSSTDIALLGIELSGLSTARLSTASVATGSLVVAVGAEDGAPTSAFGAVAFAGPPWRSLRGGEIDARLELDVRLPRQAEGALVINAMGEGLGMAVFAPRRRVLVIPSASIEKVAAKLQAHGRIPRGYLGLGLQAVAVADGAAGAMVMSVDPKGPGATAGVHQGDVLVRWDQKPIDQLQPLLRALGADSIGRQIALDLLRGGQPQQVALIVGERPAD